MLENVEGIKLDSCLNILTGEMTRRVCRVGMLEQKMWEKNVDGALQTVVFSWFYVRGFFWFSVRRNDFCSINFAIFCNLS